ncbi:MAG TPA: TonB family protein [Bryobacteraceae bacterium]|nr:TonB family protein [Bryobacteraceae bacterium]
MNDQVRTVLRERLAELGNSALGSSDSLRSVLSGTLPDATPEVDALAVAVDAHVPLELRDYSTDAEARMALDSSILHLERGLRVDRPSAAWAVLTLASATGHITDEQFHDLLAKLGGEPSVPSGPMPVAANVASQAEVPARSWTAPDRPPEPPVSTPPPPPPPPPVRRAAPPPQVTRVKPPPRPTKAPPVPAQQAASQPKQVGLGCVIMVALAVGFFRLGMHQWQSHTPATVPVPQTSPQSTGTAPKPVTDPPVEIPVEPPPPPGPPGTEPQRPTPRKVDVRVQVEKLIDQPPPKYPPLAKQARIQGVVTLKVLIAEDGTVKSAQLVSGHPLLAPAALDAVKRWRYLPTLVDGVPVEVESEADVSFKLNQ